ncbi:hypothetical protein PR048_024964 [Dryococelus australis]|uniref:Uncharacterized protein n=1 Tax=Dryococelus australis TaxID=614101 RepID=A0ABQ9GQ44_9NEOP|nr:hypothetical protein PR048_024964 [Dryococelus australis]
MEVIHLAKGGHCTKKEDNEHFSHPWLFIARPAIYNCLRQLATHRGAMPLCIVLLPVIEPETYVVARRSTQEFRRNDGPVRRTQHNHCVEPSCREKEEGIREREGKRWNEKKEKIGALGENPRNAREQYGTMEHENHGMIEHEVQNGGTKMVAYWLLIWRRTVAKYKTMKTKDVPDKRHNTCYKDGEIQYGGRATGMTEREVRNQDGVSILDPPAPALAPKAPHTYTIVAITWLSHPPPLIRAFGGVVVRLPAMHLGESGSIPVACGNRAGRRLWSVGFLRGFPVSPRPCIPALLHTHLASPSSALKTSLLRAAQISPLHPFLLFKLSWTPLFFTMCEALGSCTPMAVEDIKWVTAETCDSYRMSPLKESHWDTRPRLFAGLEYGGRLQCLCLFANCPAACFLIAAAVLRFRDLALVAPGMARSTRACPRRNSTKQRRNARAGETGDLRSPRKPSGVVRHDSHTCGNPGATPPRESNPVRSRWEASSLTTTPPRPPHRIDKYAETK